MSRPRSHLPTALLPTLFAAGSALSNGVGLTPPLGWSTWLTCGDEACRHDVCNEAEVKSAATAMASNGMRDLGWSYVVLDDCWAALHRNASDGRLVWDEARFPSGIPSLVDWLHERGFKFGLYTSAGNATCSSGGRNGTVPGSRDHYALDAQTFADGGVDYLKSDSASRSPNPCCVPTRRGDCLLDRHGGR